VDRYADYLEWLLDFSASGGLTKQQRDVLRDYLVEDWKEMDGAARAAFLKTVKKSMAIVQESAADRNKRRAARRPRLLAQLRAERNDKRSQWLLGIYEQEQKVLQAVRPNKRDPYEAKIEMLRLAAIRSTTQAR